MRKMYSEPKVERFELKAEDIIKTSVENYTFTVDTDNEGAKGIWNW